MGCNKPPNAPNGTPQDDSSFLGFQSSLQLPSPSASQLRPDEDVDMTNTSFDDSTTRTPYNSTMTSYNSMAPLATSTPLPTVNTPGTTMLSTPPAFSTRNRTRSPNRFVPPPQKNPMERFSTTVQALLAPGKKDLQAIWDAASIDITKHSFPPTKMTPRDQLVLVAPKVRVGGRRVVSGSSYADAGEEGSADDSEGDVVGKAKDTKSKISAEPKEDKPTARPKKTQKLADPESDLDGQTQKKIDEQLKEEVLAPQMKVDGRDGNYKPKGKKDGKVKLDHGTRAKAKQTTIAPRIILRVNGPPDANLMGSNTAPKVEEGMSLRRRKLPPPVLK